MAEETKFTDEEIKQIKDIQDSYAKLQSEFGQVGISKMRLQEQVDEVEAFESKLGNEFKEVQQTEKKLLDDITKKYGDGTLDPETGVFTPNK
jgi:septal ring factor EnvC (AmiA/AmiB activator)